MQDQIAATNLAVEAYQKLKETDPDHELVKYMESDKISDDEFRNRFWDKKEPWQNLPGSMVTMYVETKYLIEVRTLLREKHNINI